MRTLVVALLLTSLLAGCADESTPTETPDSVHAPEVRGTPGSLYDAGNLSLVAGLAFAGPALYPDPQNTPHPAFNWPTLAAPAVGPAPNPWWTVANQSAVPNPIADVALVIQTPGVPAGAGTALFGGLAVVPGFGAPTSVVDIREPTHPVVLSQFSPQDGLADHRGAAFIAYPTGQLVVVISTGSGIDVWDLTDPVNPAGLPPLLVEGGSHKVGVIPGTPVVVNAASDGGAQNNPATSPSVSHMWDLRDPLNAVRLPDFKNGYSCHHVYFWNNLEENKFRGICAGIDYTQIWDTADPYNPSVIVSVPFGTGGTPLAAAGSGSSISFSHYAGLSLDGKVLMVGDEHGGGAGPIGCVARVDTPAGSVSVPIGAVWFYDVSVETSPRLLGWFSASQLEKMGMQNPTNTAGLPASCTAHHGRLVPVEGRDILAMSWYGAGVVVVDFTAMRGETPGLPRMVAQFSDGSDTWETLYYNGYLYTGDLNRGMDVLRFV